MRTFACMAILAFGLACAGPAAAHTFPDNSSPHVGATVSASPKTVKVWFGGEIEPVFSTLIVKNAAGKQVSDGKGKVAPDNHKLLEASLPTPLPPGNYAVYWSVIAHDGHHTEGHFAFTVK
ncbi:MAG TPA: copper resistance protein CopC [Rhodanobacteraceae bacterium]|nr:copper resistance protein CopC [Rhodanobacteraceae bacterium]